YGCRKMRMLCLCNAQSLTNWSCVGLPSASSCTFGTVGDNSQMSVTINTTVAADLQWPSRRRSLFYPFVFPGLVGMVSIAERRRKSRGLRLLALIALSALPGLRRERLVLSHHARNTSRYVHGCH